MDSERFGTYNKNEAKAEESHIKKYKRLALLMPQHLSAQQSLLAQLPHTQQAAEEAADAIAGAAAAATIAAIPIRPEKFQRKIRPLRRDEALLLYIEIVSSPWRSGKGAPRPKQHLALVKKQNTVEQQQLMMVVILDRQDLPKNSTEKSR